MDEAELDKLQADYKKAVDDWVTAIRAEEALASVHHSVAELDKWEEADAIEHKAQQGSDLSQAPVRGRAAARPVRVLNSIVHGLGGDPVCT